MVYFLWLNIQHGSQLTPGIAQKRDQKPMQHLFKTIGAVNIAVMPYLFLSVVSIFAASPPSEFDGVWLFAGASNNVCKSSDWGQHENDRLIRIAARKIQEWESECDVLDAAIAAAEHQSTVKVNLSCSGEGMTWASTEIWHTQYVGARKALTRTQIEATNYRDDTGKSVGNPTASPISVRLYLACQRKR